MPSTSEHVGGDLGAHALEAPSAVNAPLRARQGRVAAWSRYADLVGEILGEGEHLLVVPMGLDRIGDRSVVDLLPSPSVEPYPPERFPRPREPFLR